VLDIVEADFRPACAPHDVIGKAGPGRRPWHAVVRTRRTICRTPDAGIRHERARDVETLNARAAPDRRVSGAVIGGQPPASRPRAVRTRLSSRK
jgi:hypothetical protein